MTPQAPPPFLDVEALLEPPGRRSRVASYWYFFGGFLLVGMALTYLSGPSPDTRAVIEGLYLIVGVLLVVGMASTSFFAVRGLRAEQRQVEAVEEFVQLRNWPAAAAALQAMLGEPSHNPATRVQGLIFLATVLARYHRFNDAIAVQNHLLERVSLDPATDYGLRVGRAVAMLREDHLFDADRAIAELRRLGERDHPGLALVEIYRDVKTGHPAEAVATFERCGVAMREKLGHRVGDAYALAARAYDLLGRDDDARSAWDRATLLAPAIELTRRYPEVERTATRFAPAPAPVGM